MTVTLSGKSLKELTGGKATPGTSKQLQQVQDTKLGAKVTALPYAGNEQMKCEIKNTIPFVPACPQNEILRYKSNTINFKIYVRRTTKL